MKQIKFEYLVPTQNGCIWHLLVTAMPTSKNGQPTGAPWCWAGAFKVRGKSGLTTVCAQLAGMCQTGMLPSALDLQYRAVPLLAKDGAPKAVVARLEEELPGILQELNRRIREGYFDTLE